MQTAIAAVRDTSLRSGWKDATASSYSDRRRSSPDPAVSGGSYRFGETKCPGFTTMWTARVTRCSIRWSYASRARPWSRPWCGRRPKVWETDTSFCEAVTLAEKVAEHERESESQTSRGDLRPP